MSGRRVAAGVALAIVLSAAGASATDAKTTVRLEFTAPPGCPDADDFARRVAERAPHMRRAAEDERARLFRGSVTPASSGVVGRLVVVDVDGRTSERVLQAIDCRQATDALALITALDVERPDGSNGANATGATEANGASGATGAGGAAGTRGAGVNTGASPSGGPPNPSGTSNASEASSTSPAAGPASPATAPTVNQGAAPPGTAGARTDAPDAARGAALPPEAARAGASGRGPERGGGGGGERSSSGTTSVTWSVHGAIDAFGALGIAPWPSFGGMARIGITMNRGTSPWSPSLHAGFAIAFDRSSQESGGTATFRWYAGFAEVCPLAFRVGGEGRVQPCAVGQRGVLEVDGSNTAFPEPHPRPWVAAGVDARYSLGVMGPVRIELGVAVLAVIVRQRFQFAPNPAFFTTPPIDGTIFVGAGF